MLVQLTSNFEEKKKWIIRKHITEYYKEKRTRKKWLSAVWEGHHTHRVTKESIKINTKLKKT